MKENSEINVEKAASGFGFTVIRRLRSYGEFGHFTALKPVTVTAEVVSSMFVLCPSYSSNYK